MDAETTAKFNWTQADVSAAASGEHEGGIEKWSEEFMNAVLAELERRMIAYQSRNVTNGHIDGPALIASRVKTLTWLRQFWFHPPSALVKLTDAQSDKMLGRIRR